VKNAHDSSAQTANVSCVTRYIDADNLLPTDKASRMDGQITTARGKVSNPYALSVDHPKSVAYALRNTYPSAGSGTLRRAMDTQALAGASLAKSISQTYDLHGRESIQGAIANAKRFGSAGAAIDARLAIRGGALRGNWYSTDAKIQGAFRPKHKSYAFQTTETASSLLTRMEQEKKDLRDLAIGKYWHAKRPHHVDPTIDKIIQSSQAIVERDREKMKRLAAKAQVPLIDVMSLKGLQLNPKSIASVRGWDKPYTSRVAANLGQVAKLQAERANLGRADRRAHGLRMGETLDLPLWPEVGPAATPYVPTDSPEIDPPVDAAFAHTETQVEELISPKLHVPEAQIQLPSEIAGIAGIGDPDEDLLRVPPIPFRFKAYRGNPLRWGMLVLLDLGAILGTTYVLAGYLDSGQLDFAVCTVFALGRLIEAVHDAGKK